MSTKTSRAYVAYGQKQYEFGYYEVLVAKTHRWIPFDNRYDSRELSKVTNAGQVKNSTVLYVARKEINGIMTPGKMDVRKKKIPLFNAIVSMLIMSFNFSLNECHVIFHLMMKKRNMDLVNS